MAFDEALADRIRTQMKRRKGMGEKKMFGGLCFMVNGNMACGIVKDELMVRIGKDAHANALAQPHAREMDFTGRKMKGMVYVGTAGIDDDDALKSWLDRGIEFARSLPPK